jgi:F-type H+-transporting ATPase subunit c
MAIEGAEIVKAAGFIGAGLAMGLGAIGPGVGEGMVAAKACEAIGKNPKEAGLLTRTMLVGQAVSESTGIYSSKTTGSSRLEDWQWKLSATLRSSASMKR